MPFLLSSGPFFWVPVTYIVPTNRVVITTENMFNPNLQVHDEFIQQS